MSRGRKFAGGLAALTGLLIAGCVEAGGGGEVEVGADYYGPVYGGPVVYGHPWVRDDVVIGHPPERHFAPRPEERRQAPRAAPQHEAPRGGGGERDRDHH